MAAPKSAAEPTMEDILASIRRIISDENTGTDDPTTGFDADVGDPVDDEADALTGAETDEPASQDDIDALFGPAATEDEEVDPFDAAVVDESDADLSDDDDVLDLTEDMALAPDDEGEGGDTETPMIDPIEDDLTFVPDPPQDADEPGEPAADLLPATQVADAVEDRLMSPETDADVRQAFGALANTLLARDARTIEDLITDMLRPMLKDWIDDNLAQIVERLVREEIERVSRGR
ncbi:MAG: DUF2497 domain-containing protein [Pseudomonadota bacterium]